MAAPSRNGRFIDEIYRWQNSRGTAVKWYRWDGSQWLSASGSTTIADYERLFLQQNGGSTAFTGLPAPSLTTSLRYPADAATSTTSDYVLFDFYEYQPPFQNINKGASKSAGTSLSVYNQSATDASLYSQTSEQQILLYMPEDISTGYRASWGGKNFSNIGAAALATAGSGDIGQAAQNALNTFGTAMDQFIPNAGRKAVQEVIASITGEQIGDNDIYSSTRGVILNPNTELLFSGTDLRNFTLNYKLVPRNKPESDKIKEIIKIFKRAMLPRFGAGNAFNLTGGTNIENSFIKVPNLCRVSFMHGPDLNTNVTQYKMCAITQVEVNYTPDGVYATYNDGSMVAIGLSLSFQETKLIFAEEADNY